MIKGIVVIIFSLMLSLNGYTSCKPCYSACVRYYEDESHWKLYKVKHPKFWKPTYFYHQRMFKKYTQLEALLVGGNYRGAKSAYKKMMSETGLTAKELKMKLTEADSAMIFCPPKKGVKKVICPKNRYSKGEKCLVEYDLLGWDDIRDALKK